MPSNVKVSASWKTVSALYTRVGGSWKNVAEGYTKIGGAWKSFFTSNALVVDHLVIAGGGGGGRNGNGGGGGAGGYRTSAGTSGGGASAESRVTVAVSTNYTVTVGAGGTSGQVTLASGGNGGNSVFSSITSTGGGGGGYGTVAGTAGGSGGGGGHNASGAAGTSSQGYAGGSGAGNIDPTYGAGGGGGAGAVGSNATSTKGGDGGNGVASSITGTATTRGGGGGGGANTGTIANGGSGGGGIGASTSASSTAGTVNTGGGGGGGGGNGAAGFSAQPGGSGVVILSYPSTFDIRNGAGLTYTTSVVGSNKVTVFTAGTGNIQFASAVNSSFVLLETVTLTSAQASVEFTGLNTKYGSTYQHLQIRFTARSNRANVNSNLTYQINGVTSNSYAVHFLAGNGSSAFSAAATGYFGYVTEYLPAASTAANIFCAGVIDLLDPFKTTKNKAIRASVGSNSSVQLVSGLLQNTSATTSFALVDGLAQLVAGTRVSIYGLKGS